jgi:hypothetical protein
MSLTFLEEDLDSQIGGNDFAFCDFTMPSQSQTQSQLDLHLTSSSQVSLKIRASNLCKLMSHTIIDCSGMGPFGVGVSHFKLAIHDQVELQSFKIFFF